MFDQSLVVFIVAAALITIAPGPDTFLVIGNTLKSGVRAGLASVAGIISGGFVHAALAAFGWAQVLAYSERAFLIVKLLGAGYLMYLGAKSLRAAWVGPPATGGSEVAAAGGSSGSSGSSGSGIPPRPPRRLRTHYAQGLLTNILNPKVALFYLAFLPQFMHPGDPVAAKSALLIGIHYAMGLVWLSLVAIAVARLGAALSRSSVRRSLDAAIGVLLGAFGVRLALSTR